MIYTSNYKSLTDCSSALIWCSLLVELFFYRSCKCAPASVIPACPICLLSRRSGWLANWKLEPDRENMCAAVDTHWRCGFSLNPSEGAGFIVAGSAAGSAAFSATQQLLARHPSWPRLYHIWPWHRSPPCPPAKVPAQIFWNEISALQRHLQSGVQQLRPITITDGCG